MDETAQSRYSALHYAAECDMPVRYTRVAPGETVILLTLSLHHY